MAYDTGASRVLSHLSTVPAHRCLTSQIGRDTVCSPGYGRRRGQTPTQLSLYPEPTKKLIDSARLLQVIEMDSRWSHAETARGNQNVAPARGVVREGQRKQSTVGVEEGSGVAECGSEGARWAIESAVFDI